MDLGEVHVPPPWRRTGWIPRAPLLVGVQGANPPGRGAGRQPRSSLPIWRRRNNLPYLPSGPTWRACDEDAPPASSARADPDIRPANGAREGLEEGGDRHRG